MNTILEASTRDLLNIKLKEMKNQYDIKMGDFS